MNPPQKKQIKKTIPFIIASKSIKCLGINLTKKMIDSYTKNYREFLKKIKAGTNKWKDIMYSSIARLNVVKRFILPKANYNFNVISIKITMMAFAEIDSSKNSYVISRELE